MTVLGSAGTGIGSGEGLTMREVFRRGLAISPEILRGIWLTLLFAVIGSVGRIVTPIAVQRITDDGINAPRGVDIAVVVTTTALAAAAIAVTAVASAFMTARLFAATEHGLCTLRVRAFRHIHDLPVLTQSTESRGALVSRVTGDVDQISQFLVYSGMLAVVSVGQVVVATVAMLFYSVELTALVWLCIVPLVFFLGRLRRRLSSANSRSRRTVGEMYSAISESVVGAAVVRSHAIEPQVGERIDRAIDGHRAASTEAQALSVSAFALGGFTVALATSLVLVAGTWLGTQGRITVGEVFAFVFLLTLFLRPVQAGSSIVTDAFAAVAGWRRAIGIVDTPVDLPDPGPSGTPLPPGPIDVEFRGVGFAYPDGEEVLHDIDLRIAAGSRVAIVGETGSGKSTFAKLVTRLVDPGAGSVLLSGVDVRRVPAAELRRRVMLVPQEGYLFDGTIAQNLALGDGDPTSAALRGRMRAAAEELDLIDWLDGLPHGLDTAVGQRGEALSSGERQLVALLRAHLADPGLLVLDEATSSVDPALEVRIVKALERMLDDRTSITIAHRLSTAERADEILVMDAGRVVQRGPHAQLATKEGPYARLQAAWARERR
ncbi:MAG: ABC transporter ATP-binding protein [Arachnia sp.]